MLMIFFVFVVFANRLSGSIIFLACHIERSTITFCFFECAGIYVSYYGSYGCRLRLSKHMHTTLTKSRIPIIKQLVLHVLSAQTHYLECWWWLSMFRQFRHPSSSCLLECASSLCSRLFAQILMAFIGRWPVSGTVFIESFHVSSYTLCRLNQSWWFYFCCLPIIKCCFQHVFHNRSIVSRLLQFLLFISVRLCCLSKSVMWRVARNDSGRGEDRG